MLLVMNLITVCISVNVNAQTEYTFDLDEDDSFVWEVKELNIYAFEKTFGFEPAFEKGDKTRRTIRDIDEDPDGWTLSVEFWDYKDDFEEDGHIIEEKVYDNPENYKDDIFIPTPVNDYLEELPDHDSSYVVQGASIDKRETKYTATREYDQRGVLVLEEYVDDDGILLVRVEATFRIIPMGNYFIGFIALGVISITFVMIKKKKFLIQKPKS